MPSPKSSPSELAPLALTLDELQQPTTEQAARLMAATTRVWKAKPWEKIAEDELFIVRHPDDETLSFVSAIGGGGEQAGVIVYRGANAYFGLLDFTERASQMPMLPQMPDNMAGAEEFMAMLAEQLGAANFDPMELLQLPQLQLMFEARADLDDTDEELITRHNYKATGKGFPTFRAVVPGFLPWWISGAEAEITAVALEQLCEVTERPDFSSELLETRESNGQKPTLELFARAPKTDAKGEVTWSDQRLKVSPGEETIQVEIAPDADNMERIAALPVGEDTLEVELLSMPTPMGDAEVRPHFPSLLLLGQNGAVTGMQMLSCGPGPHRLPLLFDALAELLAARETRPKTIHFASPELGVLFPLGEMMQIKVEAVEELPTLDPAIEALMEQMEDFDPDDLPEDWDDEDSPDAPRVLNLDLLHLSRKKGGRPRKSETEKTSEP